jgi:hypothetical protein
MDPLATLHTLLAAYHDHDREAVAEALDTLTEWNDRGGYCPTVAASGDGFTVWPRPLSI